MRIAHDVLMKTFDAAYDEVLQLAGLDCRELSCRPSHGEMLMNAEQRVRFEERSRIIRAMAHATRLFIVDELSRGERCVCELTAEVGADMSTVSRHLSILHTVGIVSSTKRGSYVFYSLKMPCVLGIFGCVDSVLRTRTGGPNGVQA